jgi:hypothetical protein
MSIGLFDLKSSISAAIAGVVAYNNHKLKVKPQANPQQGDENKVISGSTQDVVLSVSSAKETS